MNLPLIDVSVAADSVAMDADWHTIAQGAVHQAIAITGLKMPAEAELSVLLCDDKMIAELNAKWRNKNKPTNVLSFPAGHDNPLLGDIVISLETVQREAVLENKSFRDHFTHLLVHGFLHLFGYDHENESDAAAMEQLETKILAALDIADPYNSE